MQRSYPVCLKIPNDSINVFTDSRSLSPTSKELHLNLKSKFQAIHPSNFYMRENCAEGDKEIWSFPMQDS